MNKVVLIIDLKKLGRMKAASKSVKGTMSEKHGDRRLEGPSPTSHPTLSFLPVYCCST